MKILITESQYNTILNEVLSVTDLRGKLGPDFDENDKYFKVIVSKLGNMVVINNARKKSGRGNDVLLDIDPNNFDGLPDEFNKNIKGPEMKKDWIIQLIIDVPNKAIHIPFGEQIPNPTLLRKTIKDLIRMGYIDGNYKSVDHNQEEDPSPLRPGVSDNELYLYHGTTKDNYDKIKKIGLRPQGDEDIIIKNPTQFGPNRSTIFRGNPSTLAGYTDKNIYLTTSLVIAKDYARTQSNYNNSKPIVLRVEIPDKSKLVFDDDLAIDTLLPKIFDKLKPYYTVLFERKESLQGYDNISVRYYKTKWSGDNEMREFLRYVNLLIRNNFGTLIKGEKINNFDSFLNTLGTPLFSKEELIKFKSQIDPSFYDFLRDIFISEYSKVKNTYYKKFLYSKDSLGSAVAYNGNILPKFITVVPLNKKSF